MNAHFDPRDRSTGRRRGPSTCPDFARRARSIAEGLRADGFVVVPDFVRPEFVEALRKESMALVRSGAFRPAGVGRGATWVRRPGIRGDHVHWVDSARPRREQARLARVMERLRVRLNRELYLGLTSYECHLAIYPPGQGYVRHRDHHVGSDARVVTTTLYLNPDWVAGDGGTLRLFVDDERTVEIPPMGGVLVVFLSQELEHEVLPSSTDRWSWTGWYRRDPVL